MPDEEIEEFWISNDMLLSGLREEPPRRIRLLERIPHKGVGPGEAGGVRSPDDKPERGG